MKDSSAFANLWQVVQILWHVAMNYKMHGKRCIWKCCVTALAEIVPFFEGTVCERTPWRVY